LNFKQPIWNNMFSVFEKVITVDFSYHTTHRSPRAHSYLYVDAATACFIFQYLIWKMNSTLWLYIIINATRVFIAYLIFASKYSFFFTHQAWRKS
jgi:hypothetical protein